MAKKKWSDFFFRIFTILFENSFKMFTSVEFMNNLYESLKSLINCICYDDKFSFNYINHLIH